MSIDLNGDDDEMILEIFMVLYDFSILGSAAIFVKPFWGRGNKDIKFLVDTVVRLNLSTQIWFLCTFIHELQMET